MVWNDDNDNNDNNNVDAIMKSENGPVAVQGKDEE